MHGFNYSKKKKLKKKINQKKKKILFYFQTLTSIHSGCHHNHIRAQVAVEKFTISIQR